MASLKGAIPPFFIQGVEPTLLRQQVLGGADLLFIFSFLIFMAAYIRNREPFLYWYAGGLALTAISLTGFYIEHSVGSPVGWVGRCAQYLGGMYFFASLVVTGRSAQQQRASFDDVLTASLTAAEEKFRAAFANAPIGFAMMAPTGRYVDANSAYCALTGYSLAELRTLDFPQLVHPGDRTANLAQIQRMLAGQIPDFTVEDRYVRKGGQPVWVRKSVSLVPGPEGKPRWIVALIEDITARKQSEAELRHSQQAAMDLAREATAARAALERLAQALTEQRAELQLILDASPALIFYKDRQNRLVRVNRAFAESLGVPKEQLEGRSLFDFYPREHAEAFWSDDKEVMASGQPKLDIVERAGERWMRTDKVPCRDAAGNIVGVIGFAVDITGRVRAEEDRERLLGEVQAERDRISALVASMQDEVWFADSQRRFTLANPAAQKEFNLAAGEPVDVANFAASLEVLRPDGSARPVEEAPPLRALKGDAVINQEEIIRTPASGMLRYRQVSAAPVIDKAGQIIGSVSVVRDITDLKQAEEALRADEERLRKLYSAMNDGLALHEVVYDRAGRATDYRLLDVNPAFERITGISRERAAGALASALYGTGVPPYLDIYARVAETGEPETFEVDFEPMRKSLRISVFSPAKGQFATVFADISERKRAEEVIKRKRALLEGINRIFEEALGGRTEAELGQVCLAIAEDITGSAFSFMGEIDAATNRSGGLSASERR